MPVAAASRIRSSAYRRFIRSLPCAVCNRMWTVEAAHTGPRGLGQKSSDLSCIPLCFRHHQSGPDSLHVLGPVKFSERHGIDIPAFVSALNEIGLAGIPSLHGPGRRQLTRAFVRSSCKCGWRSAWYRNPADAQAALHHHLETG